MPDFTDWFPPALVGVSFTLLAALKIYGLRRNIVGGGGKPFGQRSLGRCPTWSHSTNVKVILMFLLIGLANFAWSAWLFFKKLVSANHRKIRE